jgi:hypothetical protein
VLFGRLKIEVEDADLIAKALKPDDMDWCYSYSDGNTLFIEVKTDKIGAMINALEDYFINLKAIMSVQNALKLLGLKD